MVRRKKRSRRGLADWIACHGFAPFPLSYEDYVGLELNRTRTENRKVYFQALANCIADSLDEVPLEIIRAVCDSEAQARRLAHTINANRKAKDIGFS